MLVKDVRGVVHFPEEKGPVIEIGRIKYKGGSAHVYLPQRIRNALKLDREKDSALVIVSVDGNSMFLVKDYVVAAQLKPKILRLRKKALRRGQI